MVVASFSKKRCLFILVCLFIPGLARAEGNMRIGRLELHPYLSVSEKYSDNVYATSSDNVSDYITTTIPGIRLQFPFRAHLIGLEYNTEIVNYANNSTENTSDQNLNGLMDFKLGSLVGLKLTEVYAKGHEPRGVSSTGFIERYETNVASASATYQLANISKIRIDYSKSAWKFDTSNFRDREEGLLSSYLYYRLLPKTSAFIEYDRNQIDYSRSGDLNNTDDSALMGLTWEITERSKGTLKGGYLWKKYDQSSNNNFETWTASIDLNHDFSDYDSLLFVGQRVVNERSLQFTRYFVTTGVNAEYTHRFVRRLASVVRGSYGEDTYSDAIAPDTTIRRDITTSAGIGMKYLTRNWLDTSIDYNRRNRDSNMDGFGYKENSYTISINMSL